MRENWLSAYDYTTDRGALFVNEYARAADPFAEVGRKTVSVQVTSVVRASDKSFQVKWRESHYERGSLAATSEWTAILTVKVKTPRSADVLRKNPLGLYVDAIAWSRELETIVTPQEQATERASTPLPAQGETPPINSDMGPDKAAEPTAERIIS